MYIYIIFLYIYIYIHKLSGQKRLVDHIIHDIYICMYVYIYIYIYDTL